jgi:hypothetical protein
MAKKILHTSSLYDIFFRRSNSHSITFTAQQVHLLPGFPIQLYDLPNSDDTIATVAFYVKYPPDVVVGNINKTLLVDIVNGSLARIGRAINKTLLSVNVYMVEELFNTTEPTTIPKNGRSHSHNMFAVIGGSVATVVFIIIVVIIGLLIYR